MQENFVIKNVKDFQLDQTLECGQCFHFKKINENEYGIAALGRLLHIKQEGENLIFFDTDKQEFEELWKNYFDLEQNYAQIKEYLLGRDDKLKDAIYAMGGVHILKQSFFETLISFIISQNKQIPHIKQIVERISEAYGPYLGAIGDTKFYGFPEPAAVASVTEEEWRSLKTGFRAPYIADAVHQVMRGAVKEEELLECGMERCQEILMQIKGVGEKIANCVMLFGLNKREAFPVDVWIKRIMEQLYFDGEVGKDVITSFAKNRFGIYGGYAQQYLFYYGRKNKIGKKVN